MASRSFGGFRPKISQVLESRTEELQKKYGEYTSVDATNYITGVARDVPDAFECGCPLGKNILKRLEEAKADFKTSEAEGRKVYAMLGGLATGANGPVTLMRLEDGTVVLAVSPLVMASNPTMTIKNGEVQLKSSVPIDDSCVEYSTVTGRFGKIVDSVLEKRSPFKLVERRLGGAHITVNSHRTYDFSIVHPNSLCRNKDSAVVESNGGPGDEGNSYFDQNSDSDQGKKYRRHRRVRKSSHGGAHGVDRRSGGVTDSQRKFSEDPATSRRDPPDPPGGRSVGLYSYGG